MNYPLIGGPHHGEVYHAEPGVASQNTEVRFSLGKPYRYHWSDVYRAYVHEGHTMTDSDLRFAARPGLGNITTLDNIPHRIVLPYDETKEALLAAVDHIAGNLRQIEQEPHAPRTMEAIRKLYTADKARIEKLLTHFTS